jgi:hypothetical protein
LDAGLPPLARKIRLEYGGAAYPVMARGNQGRDIYADDRDRKLWLETLGEACEKTGWRIHAFLIYAARCLMRSGECGVRNEGCGPASEAQTPEDGRRRTEDIASCAVEFSL